jgi:transposase InsO family protein
VEVCLSSVKRTLRRNGISRFSRWKKWHQYPPHPIPEKPGILVQIDSMVDGVPKDRLSAYALIDICSRWAYAVPTDRITTHQSLKFVDEAQRESPFRFKTLQSDNGSEFSKYFTTQLEAKNFIHRHSRVRRPTDNGHVERFIRTLQEGCLNRIPRSFDSWQKEIPEFISYYNTERPHMALGMKTPLEVLRRY